MLKKSNAPATTSTMVQQSLQMITTITSKIPITKSTTQAEVLIGTNAARKKSLIANLVHGQIGSMGPRWTFGNMFIGIGSMADGLDIPMGFRCLNIWVVQLWLTLGDNLSTLNQLEASARRNRGKCLASLDSSSSSPQAKDHLVTISNLILREDLCTTSNSSGQPRQAIGNSNFQTPLARESFVAQP